MGDDGALVAEGKEEGLGCLCVFLEKAHLTSTHISSAKSSPVVLAIAPTRRADHIL